MLTAAILAGGQARRLDGADKSALLVEGRSMLERQLSVLRHVTDDVRIISNHAERFTLADVPVLPDRVSGMGPLGGVYTALLDTVGTHVLVLACDMPFLTHAFLAHLAAARHGVDAVVPRSIRGQHPLCAVYDAAIAPRIKAYLDAGSRRVLDFLTTIRVHDVGPDAVAAFDADGRLLTNVNTPEDCARLGTTLVTHEPVRA